MPEVLITFEKEPKDLEKILQQFPAFKQIMNFTWAWNSNPVGEIRADLYVIIPKLFPELAEKNPYAMRISTKDNSHIAEKRINNLVKRIKNHYPDSKINLNYKANYFYKLQ